MKTMTWQDSVLHNRQPIGKKHREDYCTVFTRVELFQSLTNTTIIVVIIIRRRESPSPREVTACTIPLVDRVASTSNGAHSVLFVLLSLQTNTRRSQKQPGKKMITHKGRRYGNGWRFCCFSQWPISPVKYTKNHSWLQFVSQPQSLSYRFSGHSLSLSLSFSLALVCVRACVPCAVCVCVRGNFESNCVWMYSPLMNLTPRTEVTIRCRPTTDRATWQNSINYCYALHNYTH